MNAVAPEHTSHSRMWRFVQSPIVRIVIAAASMIAVFVLLQLVAKAAHFKPTTGPAVLGAVLLTMAILIATYVAYVHLIERRQAVEISARSAVPGFAVGFLLGVIVFCLVMLTLWLAGVATIGKGAGWAAAELQLLSALELGVIQAIFFYGILFRIAEVGLGTWLALVLTIIVFGAAHAGGPSASLISEATIGLEAGTLFAALYVRSRSLWPVIGVFTAWNFVEGGVFGVSTPGHTESGLLISRFHGPQILTGGAFGPEVTIVTLVVCLAVATVLFQHAIRKGNIISPFWHKKAAQ